MNQGLCSLTNCWIAAKMFLDSLSPSIPFGRGFTDANSMQTKPAMTTVPMTRDGTRWHGPAHNASPMNAISRNVAEDELTCPVPPEEGGLIHLNLAAKDTVKLHLFAESVTKTLYRLLESWKVIQDGVLHLQVLPERTSSCDVRSCPA